MSGLNINVSSNIKQVQKQLSDFESKRLKSATVRALNKTGVTVVAEAARRIKNDTALPIKYIKDKLNIKKAGRNYFVYSIEGLRKTTNLIEWVTAGQKNTIYARKAKRQGVKSKAWGKSKLYKNTFIGRGKSSGKLLVFKRDPTKPSGVAGVHGPSVRGSFYKHMKDLEDVALKRFAVVFKHEVEYEIKKSLSS